METLCLTKQDLNQAVQILKQGGVVAFPTDTVFGLGVVYNKEEALMKLKAAKGRPENKPIPTMVASLEQIEEIAYVDEISAKLIKAFMPGAFTIILKKKPCVPDYATNGFDTIGIRMPNDAFDLELISKCGKAMLVTSANQSGLPSTMNDNDALSQLDGRIDAIIAGESGGDQASTIVDATKENYPIIRQGKISEDMIQRVIKEEI